MANINRVILLGNLTRDPELRHTTGGTAVSQVGMAVNDRVKRNDEWVEETTFVEVELWSRTAEVAAEYLQKGSPVLIEGRLKLDRWEKDGQKHQRLFVKAERMQMLGTGRREASEEAAVTGNHVASEPVFAETAEDVPF